MTRTLIFGGTFNPVHLGHLRLIDETRQALGFDRVDWIPCHTPYHKDPRGLLPFAFRISLIEAALAADGGAAVNDIEGHLPTPSFTVGTLEALAVHDPANERYFVLGEREFLRLPSWKRGRDLVGLAHLVVATQPGFNLARFTTAVAAAWPENAPVAPPRGALAAFELMPERFAVLVDLPRLEISSSQVRNHWRAGLPLDHLVPSGVQDLLATHRSVVDQAWSVEAHLKTHEFVHDL